MIRGVAGCAVAFVMSMQPIVSQAADVVVGQGTTIGWAPFFVAEGLDLWKQNGLDAKVVSFPSGRLVIESILGGSATFGTATETPVALSALNNLPIRILAVIDTHEVYDLVATTEVQRIEDIRGKRLAYSSGTNAQVYLARLLDRAGLKPDDIKAISLSPSDMVSALANGSNIEFAFVDDNAQSPSPDNLIGLNNLSIAAVPEPNSFVLGLVAVGAAFTLLRLRRQRAA